MPFGKWSRFSFLTISKSARGAMNSQAERLLDLGEDAALISGNIRMRDFIDCRGWVKTRF